MSLIAVVYQLVPEAPILIAANRDELYSRSFSPPSIQSGKPRILACMDQETGGTDLGVNQNGMFVGYVSRKKFQAPYSPRSRGALCRELLRTGSARQAVDMAIEQLQSGQFNGANFVIADAECGFVIHAGNEIDVVPLNDGLSVIGHYDVGDERDERANLARRLLTLQMLDSPVKFLAIASKVFARPATSPGRPSMVYRDKDFGTIGSTLISLGKKPRDAIYQFSDGAPSEVKFEDYSPMLRDILSRGLREMRSKAKAVS